MTDLDATSARSRAVAALAAAVLLVGSLLALTGGGAPAASSAQESPRTVSFAEGDVVAREVAIVASAPARSRRGSTFAVTGKVAVRKGGRARAVRLLERRGHAWRQVAKTSTSRWGVFSFRVRAGTKLRTRTFKVRAPRARPMRAVTSGVVRVKVVVRTAHPSVPVPSGSDPAESPDPNAPAPLGSASDWTWLFGPTGPARWNPCRTITWVYNPAGSYIGSLTDMKRAFARISGLTGLGFKYVGATADVPVNGATLTAGADIVVGWSDAAHDARLATSVGIGGAKGRSTTGDVDWQLQDGFILLNRASTMPPGFVTSGAPTWGDVMEHELLHVVGLGHAAQQTQIMFPIAGAHAFGAGDLAGMKAVGATHGCLPG